MFNEILTADAGGTFSVTRALLPLLRASGSATVVTVSSVSAFTGLGSNIAYCAAKAALDVMSVSMARVFGPQVRFLSVSPASVDTDFVPGRNRDEMMKKAADTPLGRIVTPEDVAMAVLACVTHLRTATGTRIVSWSLAVLRAIAAGGMFGEIDWACSRLKQAAGQGPSGDLEAWHASWRELGGQLEAAAASAAAAGHRVSASDFSLRASVYYQWAEGLLDPDDPRAAAMYGKHLSCFDAFASQSTPVVELVEIPYGEQTIPAYVVPAAGSKGRSPAALLCDGLDANKEEMFYVALSLSLARRGITTVAFDGPGQGAALRLQGMTARHDFEVPVAACVDWLVTRSDVDAERIGFVAASWGGYYAPRAVAFEKRIKACAVMGAVFDTHACMARRVGCEPIAALREP